MNMIKGPGYNVMFRLLTSDRGFCIVNPRRVVREDGTRLAHFHVTSFREEFVWCLRLLKDW